MLATRLAKAAIGAGLLALPHAISAQGAGTDSAATLWVRGYPITRGGVTEGCSLEYNAAGRDFIYKDGAGFGIVGNISVNRIEREGEQVYFASLKVILNDLIAARPTPGTAAQIHLVSASGTPLVGTLVNSFDSDTPGGRLQTFALDDAFASVLKGIVSQGTVTVAFNRKPGGTDVRVPLDLSIKDVDIEKGTIERSPEMVAAFSDCLMQLLPKD